MVTCQNCGTANAAEATFCSGCGARLDSASSRPREIRKTVTVVFCDVTGSTELGERLDPESLRNVMSRYFERMKSVLEAHGGTVEKFIGDAVMAVFGVPVVHEDDALRAVRAAHEMRSALEQLNDELQRELSVSLAARIGVNTGSVVTGAPASGQHLVTGDAVNVGARLEQAAGADEILIGSSTFDLTRNAVEVERIDSLALKGKAEAVDAYRLVSVRPGPVGHQQRLESPMVGRERPLQALREAFDAAAEDATCRLVTVLGPAGIGKSRLVREFVAGVGGRATVLTGRCLSYGEGITYWPLAQMAIEAAGIAENDAPERAHEALRRALADASEAEVVTAHLAVMLGLDEGPLEAPWAVRRFFEALASRRPLVAVFDDVQWAEPTLLDVIEHVSDWSDASILLLCVGRSEFLDSRPDWTARSSNAANIVLEPLSEPESDTLIENLLGGPALTSHFRERIRASAQGIPLFAEEMLSMMLDDGVLMRKDDEWVATTDFGTVQVPPAISALLAARLDRLSDEERLVLEAASVVGEVFDRSAIRALVDETIRPNLDRHLGALLHKDLIRPSQSDTGGDLACRFRHILLRDAAYSAVPKSERANLHESFATYLATALGERAAELDEFIGYHLEQAHRLRTELGIRDDRMNALGRVAFEHLAAAGHRAFQRSDTLAAANLLGRASELLDLDDADRRRMAWELGEALISNGELEKAVDVVEDALKRARFAGDDVSAAYAECVLWDEWLQGPGTDLGAWNASADRLIEFFERIDDHRGAAVAWGRKARAAWMLSRFEETAQAHQRGLQHALAAGDRYVAADAREGLMGALVAGSRPLTEVVDFARSSLAEARSLGDRRLEANVLLGLARCLSYLGEHQEARRLSLEGREIVRELGHMTYYWGSAQHTARIAELAGDVDGAADDLRESCEQLQALGEQNVLPSSAGMLARIELDRGNSVSAVHWMEVAERTASPDDLDAQSRLEGLRGVLAAQRGDPTAETHFRAVISFADATDSKMDQALARLELARYLGSERREEASALAREALDLLEARGATVYVEWARDLLAELETP